MSGQENGAGRPDGGGAAGAAAIFVTVGSLFRFDRLIAAMDGWAAGSDLPVLAQIGTGGMRPSHMDWVERLDRAEFERAVAGSRLVVAHAGVGSVVTAARFGRPVVVLPRRRHLGEHTSDHQMETIGWLRDKPGIWVAEAEDRLADAIDSALAMPAGTLRTLPPVAPDAFIARLRHFLVG